MIVNTPHELIEAAFGILDERIDVQSVKISDGFVLSIKIEDEKWDDPYKLDYRTANLVLKIQKDLLGIYNIATGENVTFKNICKHPDLIVKVRIEEGCINAIAEVANLLRTVFSDMTPKQKIATLSLILGIMTAGGAAWLGHSYIQYLKDVELAKIKSENQLAAIEALEKTNIALIENRRTPTYISSQMTEEGTVRFGEEKPLTKADIKKKASEERPVNDGKTCDIDGVYNIEKYDFKEQKAFLTMNGSSFWASTQWLADEAKARLKQIADQAIDAGTMQSAPLWVTATIKDRDIKNAAIIGISAKRPTAIKIEDAIARQAQKAKATGPQQVSLLDILGDGSPE